MKTYISKKLYKNVRTNLEFAFLAFEFCSEQMSLKISVAGLVTSISSRV